MRRAPHRGRIAGGVHVHDVGAERDVHGGGQAEPARGGEQARARRAAGRGARGSGRARRPGPGPSASPSTIARLISSPGLARHAELARPEARGDVLRRVAGHRQLEVVDDARAVQREAGDEPPLHQVDEHRRQADLQDVRAQPPDDRPAQRARAQDLARHAAQRRRAARIRGSPSRNAARPLPRGVGARELRQRHLALAVGQRIRAHAGEVERLVAARPSPSGGHAPLRSPGRGRGRPWRGLPGCAASCDGARR